MVTEHCSSCRYFLDHQQMGQCRRFPAFVNRHRNESCGEYSEKAVETVAEEEKPKRKYVRKAKDDQAFA